MNRKQSIPQSIHATRLVISRILAMIPANLQAPITVVLKILTRRNWTRTLLWVKYWTLEDVQLVRYKG